MMCTYIPGTIWCNKALDSRTIFMHDKKTVVITLVYGRSVLIFFDTVLYL